MPKCLFRKGVTAQEPVHSPRRRIDVRIALGNVRGGVDPGQLRVRMVGPTLRQSCGRLTAVHVRPADSAHGVGHNLSQKNSKNIFFQLNPLEMIKKTEKGQ